MACDVVSSPFQETSAFEDDWQKSVANGPPQGDGLGLIADFNASCNENITAFDQNINNSTDCSSINPQLLSSPGTASNSLTGTFDQDFDQDDVFAYPDYNQPAPTNTPYFHPAETSQARMPAAFASPLRNQLHRRSVSEPPEAFPHHQPSMRYMPGPPQPPMTFTRQGHYLGAPKPQPEKLKSLPRSKPYRAQPYSTRGGQSRYQLRRTNTQPVQMRPIAPTSMPQQQMYMPSPPPAPQHQQFSQSPQPFISSRVCTPAPSPVREMMSPGVIDPALMGEKRFVSVPVDELRAMITEAVKKAVEGIEGIGKNIVEGRTQKMAAIDEVEDVAESIEGCEDDEGDTIAVKVDGSEL